MRDQGKQQNSLLAVQPQKSEMIGNYTGMEKRITLLENEYACLWYYPAPGIVHHKFLQPISGDRFREVLNTGLELLQEQGAQKWLSDDRNNSVLSADDSAWSQEYWLPRALQAGWKYWAMLPPLRSRAQLNITRLVEYVNEIHDVRIELFSNPDAARKWLERQGDPEAAQ